MSTPHRNPRDPIGEEPPERELYAAAAPGEDPPAAPEPPQRGGHSHVDPGTDASGELPTVGTPNLGEGAD